MLADARVAGSTKSPFVGAALWPAFGATSLREIVRDFRACDWRYTWVLSQFPTNRHVGANCPAAGRGVHPTLLAMMRKQATAGCRPSLPRRPILSMPTSCTLNERTPAGRSSLPGSACAKMIVVLRPDANCPIYARPAR